MINKVLGSINKLYEECLDTWLTFILSYAIGLRWSEIRSARYSWFGHEMVNDGKGGRAKRYYCNVQATAESTPKACSLGKVTISKETYDMVLATEGVSRERLTDTAFRLFAGIDLVEAGKPCRQGVGLFRCRTWQGVQPPWHPEAA